MPSKSSALVVLIARPRPRRTLVRCRAGGFSLTELLAVVAVLALLAALLLPKVTGYHDQSKVGACHVYRGDIEIQVEIWRHNTGSWPAANLSDIGADPDYFPQGLPTCPVDGSAYTIDSQGRAVGHEH